MSTLDDRAFRKMIAGVLREMADRVESREVVAIEFASLPARDCPDGYQQHTVTFRVRRS
jgi:hypothetical protein